MRAAGRIGHVGAGPCHGWIGVDSQLFRRYGWLLGGWRMEKLNQDPQNIPVAERN